MLLFLQFFLWLVPRTSQVPSPVACVASQRGRLVPTQFAGGRIFALLHLNGHGDLRLYTDTGGGPVMLYPDAVRRVSTPIDTIRWMRDTTHVETLVAKIPVAEANPSFPPIPAPPDSASVKILVAGDPPAPPDEPGITWDGRLGAAWFAGGVWTFDYPHQRLYFNGSAATGPSDPKCWVPIGFQKDSASGRNNVYPRIAATIDGDTVQFLFDTGARTELTPSAFPLVDPKLPRHRATSFIEADRFEQWHARHPEWLFVPRAEAAPGNSAMIRVPSIAVGGRTVGPVWFTERPNSSFRDFMSQYTDRPVEGALGGSAWRYVTLIVDYPRARAAVLAPSRD